MPCDATRSTVTETSGPTELGVGGVADGEYLRRVGDQIVGDTPSGGPSSGSATAEALSDQTNFIAGDTISGSLFAVGIDDNGKVQPAYVASGIIAIGVLEADVLSGAAATVRMAGHLTSPYLSVGTIGAPLWVTAAGVVHTTRPNTSPTLMLQKIGFVHSASGMIVVPDAQASGGITVPRLGSGCVIGQAIANGVITSGKLGASSVSAPKIASGQIIGLAGGQTMVASGTFGPNDLAALAVQSGHLADGSVASGAIASGQVGLIHFASGISFPVSLSSGQVQSGHVGDAAIVAGSIASGQVSQSHLASGAVNSGHVASGAVSFASIASGQVQSTSLGSGAVVSGRIASGQVGGSHLASGLPMTALTFLATIATPMSGLRAVTFASGNVLVAADGGSGLRLPAVGIADFGFAGTGSGATVAVYGPGAIFNMVSGHTANSFTASVSGLVGPLYIVSGGGAAGQANVGRMTTTIPASGVNQQRVAILRYADLAGGQILVMPDNATTSGVAGGFR